MSTVYFLVFVAVCALALVWFSFRSTRKARRSSRTAGRQRHDKPLYRHKMAGHAVLHSHTGHLPSESQDIWRTRRPNAHKEHWEARGTITASRIQSDDEVEQGADDEMTMSVIEYTPEEASPRAAHGAALASSGGSPPLEPISAALRAPAAAARSRCPGS
jgi:hypothetical protein